MSDANFLFILLMLLALVVVFGVTIAGLEVWEFFKFGKR